MVENLQRVTAQGGRSHGAKLLAALKDKGANGKTPGTSAMPSRRDGPGPREPNATARDPYDLPDDDDDEQAKEHAGCRALPGVTTGIKTFAHGALGKRPGTLGGSEANKVQATVKSMFKRNHERSQLSRQSPAGMVNLGNTCYLNSVVQVLLHMPSFLADLQHPDLAAPAGRLRPHLPPAGVCAALQKTSNRLRAAARERPTFDLIKPAVEPGALRAAMGRLCGRWRTYAQQDAHEFLVGLLEGLQSEVLAAEAAARGVRRLRLSETRCPAARNLGGCLVHTWTCSACGRTTRAKEPFSCLSLQLPPAGSVRLQDLMAEYLKLHTVVEVDVTLDLARHCDGAARADAHLLQGRPPEQVVGAHVDENAGPGPAAGGSAATVAVGGHGAAAFGSGAANGQGAGGGGGASASLRPTDTGCGGGSTCPSPSFMDGGNRSALQERTVQQSGQQPSSRHTAGRHAPAHRSRLGAGAGALALPPGAPESECVTGSVFSTGAQAAAAEEAPTPYGGALPGAGIGIGGGGGGSAQPPCTVPRDRPWGHRGPKPVGANSFFGPGAGAGAGSGGGGSGGKEGGGGGVFGEAFDLMRPNKRPCREDRRPSGAVSLLSMDPAEMTEEQQMELAIQRSLMEEDPGPGFGAGAGAGMAVDLVPRPTPAAPAASGRPAAAAAGGGGGRQPPDSSIPTAAARRSGGTEGSGGSGGGGGGGGECAAAGGRGTPFGADADGDEVGSAQVDSEGGGDGGAELQDESPGGGAVGPRGQRERWKRRPPECSDSAMSGASGGGDRSDNDGDDDASDGGSAGDGAPLDRRQAVRTHRRKTRRRHPRLTAAVNLVDAAESPAPPPPQQRAASPSRWDADHTTAQSQGETAAAATVGGSSGGAGLARREQMPAQPVGIHDAVDPELDADLAEALRLSMETHAEEERIRRSLGVGGFGDFGGGGRSSDDDDGGGGLGGPPAGDAGWEGVLQIPDANVVGEDVRCAAAVLTAPAGGRPSHLLGKVGGGGVLPSTPPKLAGAAHAPAPPPSPVRHRRQSCGGGGAGMNVLADVCADHCAAGAGGGTSLFSKHLRGGGGGSGAGGQDLLFDAGGGQGGAGGGVFDGGHGGRVLGILAGNDGAAEDDAACPPAAAAEPASADRTVGVPAGCLGSGGGGGGGGFGAGSRREDAVDLTGADEEDEDAQLNRAIMLSLMENHPQADYWEAAGNPAGGDGAAAPAGNADAEAANNDRSEGSRGEGAAGAAAPRPKISLVADSDIEEEDDDREQEGEQAVGGAAPGLTAVETPAMRSPGVVAAPLAAPAAPSHGHPAKAAAAGAGGPAAADATATAAGAGGGGVPLSCLARYRLCGVVRHKGATPFSGHYVADVLVGTPQGSAWYEHNDSVVSLVDLSRVREDAGRQAYMLFFVNHATRGAAAAARAAAAAAGGAAGGASGGGEGGRAPAGAGYAAVAAAAAVPLPGDVRAGAAQEA
ncbi:hypothetical protein GPECTOR_379g176 [Gonium pectorale]|uniref:USP domain-containing protein n=1 Tax=Gonium pectorale TaxID=33097 RepID=A0A150FVE7_GONPE|nr:hypothetical protein GPECTOR_379g176 [Gonium pectorale]|eukprot:KXZ41584.1 hypothetical protein GPECTOR_379g176 [Gonium pectorale]